MDIRYHTETCCYIDDYTPSRRNQGYCSFCQSLVPDKKITGIFQPHLYSRTRDFAQAFADSLSLLDRVVLLPVYPAREAPIPGIHSHMLAGLLDVKETYVMEPEEVTAFVKTTKPQVLLTMGAGSIDRLVAPIADCLKEMRL